jgi:glycosyltransferase involved in cell wall biosynthesis
MTIRLTLVVDSPARWAHGNAASRLALGLAQTGLVEPTLLCYSNDPSPSLPPEVRVERLGVDRARQTLPGLIAYLRRSQPDVLITRQVHANFFGLVAAAAARVPRGWKGKLILVQDHPIALSHAANWRDNKWLAKLTYRFADGVISPSPAVRDDIVAWCGLDPLSTAIVPNPIPKFSDQLPPPHPWLHQGDLPVFVHTSNMMPWKRIDLLLEAFANLVKRHEARLLILGEGPGRGQAIEQIRALGLSGRAEAVGWVEDPRQYAARACAFVLASDEEGFAQVLTEAMSAGCPVVATDAQGGGPRFVTDSGRYGILVPMRDLGELTNGMEQMLDPQVRARYSAQGLERALALSPEACATSLIDFLATRFGFHC